MARDVMRVASSAQIVVLADCWAGRSLARRRMDATGKSPSTWTKAPRPPPEDTTVATGVVAAAADEDLDVVVSATAACQSIPATKHPPVRKANPNLLPSAGPGCEASPTRIPRRPHWCDTGRPNRRCVRRLQVARCTTRTRRHRTATTGSWSIAQWRGCHTG